MKIKETSTVSNRELTPPYARYLVPLIRPFPDFDLFFVKSLRQRAVRRLQLNPGDRVLDAGCGPGGSFPYLVDAVTPSGAVVGVEISPEMAKSAKQRIERNSWTNVDVIVADAKQVKLPGTFNGLLMLGAPDIYASAAALANLAPYLEDDARVVAFGAKLSRGRWGKSFNPIFRGAFSKATFASTPKLDYEPWKPLEGVVGKLEVEELFFGWMFLAWGQRKPSRAARSLTQCWNYSGTSVPHSHWESILRGER
jgi:SAM-dependent methyltransferase